MSYKVFNSAELWQQETSLPSIPTFSQSLDNVFGNDGVQLGCLTEVLGLPGSGKTQICIQLCASVQIPKTLGGLDAEALFIDTNTNFTAERFRDIVTGSLTKCHKLLGLRTEVNEEAALKRLHYVDAFGLEQYCATMIRLPRLLQEHSNIRLIVIDSIAFPFKDGISPSQRTGLLFRQMTEVQRLAIEKQIAVVVTNEMTTRVGLSGGDIVGSLGDAWAHRCNKRVLLTRDGAANCERTALCLKSNNSGNVAGRFRVVVTNEMTTRVGLSGGDIVGSLGDAWAHRCNKRVLLTRDGAANCERTALCLKSNNSGNVAGRFRVVVTNEMTTRVGLSGGDIVGSLGDAWAHRCNKRVLLTRDGAANCERTALCLKSNNSGNVAGRFRITREGIRDIE